MDSRRKTMTCPKCSHTNTPGMKYCGFCGTTLQPSAAQNPAAAKNTYMSPPSQNVNQLQQPPQTYAPQQPSGYASQQPAAHQAQPHQTYSQPPGHAGHPPQQHSYQAHASTHAHAGGSTVNVNVMMSAPIGQLDTNRSLLKYILLSIVTCGIYAIILMSAISTDINIIAGRYDGRKTMHFCLLFFLVGPITLGIGYVVWSHKISSRIGRELVRRGIYYHFDAGTYWIFSWLVPLVGVFIYNYKLFKAMNLLSEDFNING